MSLELSVLQAASLLPTLSDDLQVGLVRAQAAHLVAAHAASLLNDRNVVGIDHRVEWNCLCQYELRDAKEGMPRRTTMQMFGYS